MKKKLIWSLVGLAMGIVEVIPGISSGTIALITGIYYTLINAIRGITLFKVVKVFNYPRQLWISAGNNILFYLIIGMVPGLMIGVHAITYLLINFEIVLLAFFIGLILASAILLATKVLWRSSSLIFLILGGLISFGYTFISPSDGFDHPLYLVFCGIIAISTMILPGISGSFMLLLLGAYDTVIYALKDILSGQWSVQAMTTFGLYILGGLVGLFSTVRILSHLFKHYYHTTMALLIGILLGSLNELWPWKLTKTIMHRNTGSTHAYNNIVPPDEDIYKVISDINITPLVYRQYGGEAQLGEAGLAFAIGLLAVWIITLLNNESV